MRRHDNAMAHVLCVFMTLLTSVHFIVVGAITNLNTGTKLGLVTFTSPTSVNITYTNGGSSLVMGGQIAGTLCLNVVPPSVPGIALSIRIKVGDEGNTNLMESLWYPPLSLQKQFYTNLWGPITNQNLITGGKNLVAAPGTSIDSYYCMTWNISGNAFWYVNGIEVQTQSLAAITRPLIPEFLVWGNLSDAWFITQVGRYTGAALGTAQLANVYISQTQETIPNSVQPSSVPSTTLTHPPSRFPLSTIAPTVSRAPLRNFPSSSVPTLNPTNAPTRILSLHSTPTHKPTYKTSTNEEGTGAPSKSVNLNQNSASSSTVNSMTLGNIIIIITSIIVLALAIFVIYNIYKMRGGKSWFSSQNSPSKVKIQHSGQTFHIYPHFTLAKMAKPSPTTSKTSKSTSPQLSPFEEKSDKWHNMFAVGSNPLSAQSSSVYNKRVNAGGICNNNPPTCSSGNNLTNLDIVGTRGSAYTSTYNRNSEMQSRNDIYTQDIEAPNSNKNTVFSSFTNTEYGDLSSRTSPTQIKSLNDTSTIDSEALSTNEYSQTKYEELIIRTPSNRPDHSGAYNSKYSFSANDGEEGSFGHITYEFADKLSTGSNAEKFSEAFSSYRSSGNSDKNRTSRGSPMTTSPSMRGLLSEEADDKWA